MYYKWPRLGLGALNHSYSWFFSATDSMVYKPRNNRHRYSMGKYSYKYSTTHHRCKINQDFGGCVFFSIDIFQQLFLVFGFWFFFDVITPIYITPATHTIWRSSATNPRQLRAPRASKSSRQGTRMNGMM